MASIIRIKRSGTSGNPATLGAGELAYSALADNGANGGDRLYVGFGTETNGNAANHVVIGGKYFTDKLDHTLGTLTANSAILVDADSKIDNLKVDNLDLNGNTISSTDTNGNIVLDPNGTGYVTITGTNGAVIPVGTTAQRGPAVQGTVRYNTTTSSFEGYNGAQWGSLGGVKSVDQLTYITAESSPGASDDTLSFVTDNVERFFIDTDSAEFDSTVVLRIDNVTQSTSTTTGSVVTAGGLGVAKNVYVGGNLDVAGTMNFTGGADFQGSVTIAGSETPDTELFTIHDGSSSETVAFQVDSANGNTTVAGTLTVNGVSLSGALGAGGDLSTESNLTVDGNTTLGDANTDIITFNAKMHSSILVDADGSYALGDTTNRWSNIFVDAATITNNTTIGGTLGVTGAATLSSTLGVTGNTTIGGTLGVTGESTLASATVSDLTSGRVVLAGTSGALEDSANLTFNGTTLTANAAAVTNNATVGGTLGVTGAATLSSTLAVTGTSTFTGATTHNGGLNSTTGDFSGAVGIDGNFDIATNKFTVNATSGNTVIAGSLTNAGAVDIGTTSSTVDIEASTLDIDSTDTTSLTMSANSASTKAITIDATNAGSGEAQIYVGTSSTDQVKVESLLKTTIDSAGELELNGDTSIDINGGSIAVDGSTIVTTASTSVTTNTDTMTIQGAAGAGNDAAIAVEGSLIVDGIKIDGNTISNTSNTTMYIDPYPVDDNGGTVVIKGNLQVDGTTTTVNSSVVTIDDPIFVLGGDGDAASDDNLDRGILFKWHNGSAAKEGFFGYDESTNEFVFIEDATNTAEVVSGTLGDVAFGNGRFAATTGSTSDTTGAVTIAGGLGVAENIYAGGILDIGSTTESSSTSTGSIITAGGIGVAKSIVVGANITGAGAATSTLDGFDIDGGTY